LWLASVRPSGLLGWIAELPLKFNLPRFYFIVRLQTASEAEAFSCRESLPQSSKTSSRAEKTNSLRIIVRSLRECREESVTT